MTAYGITIRDTASPAIEALIDGLNDPALKTAVGEAGKLILMEHFEQKNATGSHKAATRLGAKPTGLYAEFAQATSWQRSGADVLLSIAHPAIAQRYYGGTIKPVNRKYLTIPANSAAYGKRARNLRSQLVFMFRMRNGAPAPVALIHKKYKNQKRVPSSGVYYWLVKSVTQSADHSVLPTDAKMLDGVQDQLQDWLTAKINAAG
ncbi:MAG: hypothetical protein EOM20_19600 [Spartobacteria bacterium]|nr:hypothetical protein [Spartobacteria bacterium]